MRDRELEVLRCQAIGERGGLVEVFREDRRTVAERGPCDVRRRQLGQLLGELVFDGF